MNNKIIGTVESVGQTQEISEKFRKREMVIKTDAQFNNEVMIEFTQQNCELLDSVKIGEVVEIDINIGGRGWTNPNTGELKHFVSIQGWRISIQNGSIENKPSIPQEPTKKASKPKTKPETPAMDDDDGLPF